MSQKIIGDQSLTVNYFLQGLVYVEENELPKKQRLMAQIQKVKVRRKLKNGENVQEGKSVLYAITTRQASLEWLKSQLMFQSEDTHIICIVLDFFKDSAITTEYIKAYLHRGQEINKKMTFYCVEHREDDYMQQIEDEYNGTFSYKSLSRYYQKKIQEVMVVQLSVMEEEILEAYYASRYMV